VPAAAWRLAALSLRVFEKMNVAGRERPESVLSFQSVDPIVISLTRHVSSLPETIK
jgi:hypothetical protein